VKFAEEIWADKKFLDSFGTFSAEGQMLYGESAFLPARKLPGSFSRFSIKW